MCVHFVQHKTSFEPKLRTVLAPLQKFKVIFSELDSFGWIFSTWFSSLTHLSDLNEWSPSAMEEGLNSSPFHVSDFLPTMAGSCYISPIFHQELLTQSFWPQEPRPHLHQVHVLLLRVLPLLDPQGDFHPAWCQSLTFKDCSENSVNSTLHDDKARFEFL